MALEVELMPGKLASVNADYLKLLHTGDLVTIVGECEGFLVVNHDGVLTAMHRDELAPVGPEEILN